MPQLIPYFFVNQLFFAFFAIFVLIILLSIYFLPNNSFKQIIRTYVTKLKGSCSVEI